MYYYVLKCDGEMTEIKTSKRLELKDYYRLINCDCIAYVKCIDGETNMIIDDEGKLKDKPLNLPASVIYGALPYDCIAGDVILCTEKVINKIGERDFYGFETPQFDRFEDMINEAFGDYIAKWGFNDDDI